MRKKLLSLLLSFALVLTMIPKMSQTVHAETYSGDVDDVVTLQAGDIIESSTHLNLYTFPTTIVLKAGGYCDEDGTSSDDDFERDWQGSFATDDDGSYYYGQYFPYLRQLRKDLFNSIIILDFRGAGKCLIKQN